MSVPSFFWNQKPTINTSSKPMSSTPVFYKKQGRNKLIRQTTPSSPSSSSCTPHDNDNHNANTTAASQRNQTSSSFIKRGRHSIVNVNAATSSSPPPPSPHTHRSTSSIRSYYAAKHTYYPSHRKRHTPRSPASMKWVRKDGAQESENGPWPSTPSTGGKRPVHRTWSKRA